MSLKSLDSPLWQTFPVLFTTVILVSPRWHVDTLATALLGEFVSIREQWNTNALVPFDSCCLDANARA